LRKNGKETYVILSVTCKLVRWSSRGVASGMQEAILILINNSQSARGVSRE